MTIDLDELERLAKAATPGPWHAFSQQKPWEIYDCRWAVGSGHMHALAVLDAPQTSAALRVKADAQHIAAANPETVLALVERVRELEQGLKVIRDECHAAVNEAEFREGGSKGMQMPYHGPFASGLRLPSVVRDLRQQRAFIDRVLAGESHE